MSSPSETSSDSVIKPNIYLYYANIMDYFRIIFSLLAFYIAKTNPIPFTILYFTSFILDAFDGMVARHFHQTSKLGATLDMVTDRVSTAGLLCVLSNFYPDYSHYFVFMIMLDVGSHWLQTHSGFMVDAHNDNHKNLGEKFLLLKLYYTNRNFLGTICLGAEVFLLMLYYAKFNKWLFDNTVFMVFFYLCFAIYVFKQIISIVQIFGASKRIADFDVKEAISKMQQKKKN